MFVHICIHICQNSVPERTVDLLIFVCVFSVCVCSVWVPCVALPSGGGSSVGPSLLCGSPVRVPCAGPLPKWVLCVGPL